MKTEPESKVHYIKFECKGPFVVPRYELGGIRDWRKLLNKETDGTYVLNNITAAVITYMPCVGVTELTTENGDEAWCRIAIYQALFGSMLNRLDENGKGDERRPVFLTRLDVLRHIGLETEGHRSSFQEFCATLPSDVKRAIEKREKSLEYLPSFVANGNRSLLSKSQLE